MEQMLVPAATGRLRSATSAFGPDGLLEPLEWPSIRHPGSIGKTAGRVGHRMWYRGGPRACPG